MNCPKCGYRRKATESVPDWQCPSCGVAYAKVLNAPNPPTRYAAPAPTAPESGGSSRFLNFGLAAVVASCIAVMIAKPEIIPLITGKPAGSAPRGSVVAKKPHEIDWTKSYVVMYSLTTCSFCEEKRHEMQAQGVPFLEYFLDLDPTRMDEFRGKLKGAGMTIAGTPSFDVNGRFMPNNPPLDHILKQASF
jgi:ribosomal protein L37AE/L43A